ncbi:MAG: zinc-ribbon domain-containing protein, partial [Candidatus Cryosericum sp.]
MEPAKYCSECGKPLPPEAKHCPNCGADVTDQPAVPADDVQHMVPVSPIQGPLPQSPVNAGPY